MERRIIYFIIVCIIISSNTVKGLSIGASPDRVLFNRYDETKSIAIFNPNRLRLSYNVSYNKNIYSIADDFGTIKPDSYNFINISINKKFRNNNTREDTILIYFHDQSGLFQVIPGISVIASISFDTKKKESGQFLTSGKEKRYSVRKLVDYDSLKVYSTTLIDKVREADRTKKGLCIVFIEVLIGLYFYYKRDILISVLRKSANP